MPTKRNRQQHIQGATSHIVLRENGTNRHRVVKRKEIILSKKEGLKAGAVAKYNGSDNSAQSFDGTIIMSGSREQCENSLLLIEKSQNQINKNRNTPDKTESDASNHLVIDEDDGHDKVNHCTTDNKNERADISNEYQESFNAHTTIDHPNTSSISFETRAAFATLAHTTASSISVVSKETNISVDVSNKRREPIDEADENHPKTKRTEKVSHSEYERLKTQVKKLKRELELYKENWMPKPVGPAACYLIEIGKILSGTSNPSDEELDKEARFESILETLRMSESELLSCQHDTDITKTCRQIVKYLFRDPKERAKMLVSSMDAKILKSIQDYARLVHPAQSKASNSVLNNALGNVFATDKRKYGRAEEGAVSSEDGDD